jgi:hypothetical protein
MSRSKKWIVAALAVTVVTASLGVASASAARIAASEYPAQLIGNATGQHRITLSKLSTTCKQSSISGSISKPGDPYVANALYSECSYYAGQMLVNMGTCTYQFNVGEETSPGYFTGTLTIGPVGCAISLTAPGCKQTIPAQTARATINYTNTTGTGGYPVLLIDADVSGLTYTTEGVNCAGPASGTGWIEGEWEVKAVDGVGKALGTWVESRNGLYVVTGEKSPSLTAEILPASISGQQSSTSKQKFNTNNGTTFECSGISYSGSISSASSQFDLTPSYSGCKLVVVGSNLSATVNSNGCTYRYTVTGSSPYSGTVALVCPEGKSLEVTASVACTLKIPAQTLGTVTYTNSIGQTGRSVSTSASGSKLSYSTSGFACGTQTGGKGTYSGGSVLQ